MAQIVGRLEGKVALVTGAGRGLGRSIATRFAAEGAHVAVVSRTQSTVDAVVEDIASSGGSAIGVQCDVTDKAQVLGAVDAVLARWGGLDILVNNAQQTSQLTNPITSISDEQFEVQHTSGPVATLHFMQASFESLQSRRGVVINLATGAGLIGAANYGAYSAAKEAIRALSRTAAREWGPQGVRVNVICPTTLTDGLAEAVQDPKVAKMVSRVPLGMPLSPDESVAPVALFLATDDSRYITGSTFMVDGGASIDAGR
jgi:3-oxoacyl-[acyl-carrier protein] reductase